ncbi:MAG: L-threonylcarbamoyladenylate synthase [Myxococcota bacterium]|nr:L-threonylcarbamoyladenylate synthase [Myxococcota bacterium]
MSAPAEEAQAGLSLAQAVTWLRADGLVAFPTETVWGLGADAASEPAVAGLRAWKGREADRPMAVLVDGVESARRLGARFDPAAERLARLHWPGPLTLVLPFHGRLARGVAREDGALGLRCSPHPLARRLSEQATAAGLGPLTATSLNRSGEPAAAGRDQAAALCGAPGGPQLLGGGPDCGGGEASTVVDCTGPAPKLLREGALPWRELLGADAAQEGRPA